MSHLYFSSQIKRNIHVILKRTILIAIFALFLAGCAVNNTVPLQPGNEFYNAHLTVKKSYEIPSTFAFLGFTLPATNYKALMQDQNGKGIYFSAPEPIMAHDPLMGTVYRTGGIYYQRMPSQAFYLYLIDTTGFAGAQVLSSQPLTGLRYQISKH